VAAARCLWCNQGGGELVALDAPAAAGLAAPGTPGALALLALASLLGFLLSPA
jgi:hypothetical protein